MKYSLWQNIKYRLNYDKTVVHLQSDLNNFGLPNDIAPFVIRELNYEDPDEMINWAKVVNNAYNDSGKYDFAYAQKHLNSHLFLNLDHVYIIFDGTVQIGTISIGSYKCNSNIGGLSRLAVIKEYQGHKLGKFLLLYAFLKLRQKGFKFVECIITITRRQSLHMHFSLGFIPQFQRKYVTYKDQKRFWIVRAIVNYKLKSYYIKYLNSFGKNFRGSN